MDLPKLDTFESAVTFSPDCDPVSAHWHLEPVFGQKAGFGRFLFCADSTVAGRYWVRSIVPWRAQPAAAVSVLAPRRVALELTEGLIYRFSLAVCVGSVELAAGYKRVRPYTTPADFEDWFKQNSAEFGVRPSMVHTSLHSLRFTHAGSTYRVGHAILEGELEVSGTERLVRRLLRGFGSHRRLGLGMMKLQS